MDDQNKNLILATVLSFFVILGWFVVGPMLFPSWFPTETAANAPLTALPPEQAAPATDAAAAAAALAATPAAAAPRLTLDTPKLFGSISTLGGRFDDLSLKTYRQTVQPNSPNVDLLSPVGSGPAYYAVFGFQPGTGLTAADVPGYDTQWQAVSGKLEPGQPVTMTWNNTKGLTFTRTIAVDANFMFTITDKVDNTGTAVANLAPIGVIARHGLPKLEHIYVVHEGLIQRTDGILKESSYAKITGLADFESAKGEKVEAVKDGWIGFTDHYWMTTLIPEQGKPFSAVTKYTPGSDIYQVEVRQPLMSIAPGGTASSSIQLFAGAKEWEAIHAYQNQPNWYEWLLGDRIDTDRPQIAGFIDSIDWGWFFFLTKPIFSVLHWLHGIIGNMGLSIIALTFILKLLVFPLVYKSSVSMARMKELQPEIEALKERAGDDKQKMQREMMALYKEKKVNPAAGCLPILPQIPIFFSLYKVIFVTIELRQSAFFGWLNDLSQPDTSSIMNLFGLLPWAGPEPHTLLATVFIGLLPILLGISMWFQQKLNPAPPDPVQQQIFAWMPWVFMFMLGGFASGLVLYWITNNTITFAQQ
ncbi:MAG: membrane protein insertase YidC, partial [Candidatus Saccharibacteria bacterium]|nr:membrane protein insertase YidC [Pseudorhodobacter sp.]